jgi:nitrogenase molybdenum-iron protein alpha/beta subunit
MPDSDFTIPFNFAAPYLDGVYLAVNAIPDAYLVYDAHDCGYYKAEKIAGNHDLFSNLLRWDQSNRVMRTNVEMADHIMGGDDKLSKKLLQVGRRHRPKIIFVARSSTVIAAGHDARPVLRDLRKKLKIPLVLIPDAGSENGFVSGYLDALDGLTAELGWKAGRAGGKRVALAGYLYDRNEGDHLGNVAELKRLLAGIGAKPSTILADGSPFAKIKGRQAPGLVVNLAAGWEGSRRLARRYRARHLASGLPVGLEGTCAWLRRVAKALKLKAPAEKFIDRELSGLVPRLHWLLPRFFQGRSALLFADRLHLEPLGRFLEEMGFTIAGAGCTSTRPVETPWPQVPLQIPELRQFLAAAHDDGRADLTLGNSVIRQVARDFPVPFVELGYPSNFHHRLHPAPFLGFSGVRVLVERMINAILNPGGPRCG